MRSHLVVVSAPSLAVSRCVVAAHEPVLVQALRPELAVERLDERIVRSPAGSAEVERDAAGVRPQIQVARDELAALVDVDRRRIPLDLYRTSCRGKTGLADGVTS